MDQVEGSPGAPPSPESGWSLRALRGGGEGWRMASPRHRVPIALVTEPVFLPGVCTPGSPFPGGRAVSGGCSQATGNVTDFWGFSRF